MELVVGAECWESARANAVGEEYLSGSVNPWPWTQQLFPPRGDVVEQPIRCSRQCNTSDQQNQQNKVWEESSEPDDLEKKCFFSIVKMGALQVVSDDCTT